MRPTSTLTGIAGKQVTIDLAGTKAQAITDVEVSAMINPGQSRFAALRSFELWACDSALLELRHRRRVHQGVHERRRRIPGRCTAAERAAADHA